MRYLAALLVVSPAIFLPAGAAMAQDDSAHAGHAAQTHPTDEPGDEGEQTGMDHGTMDHAAMDHSAMGDTHAGHEMPMQSMPEHAGQMDHSMHQGHSAVADVNQDDMPGDALPPPVPQEFAADSIFGPDLMVRTRQDLYRGMRFTGFSAGMDKLEYRASKGENSYAFEGAAQYGGDIDRAVLAYKGEGNFGDSLESLEIDAYWRRAISPFFDLQVGARQNFRPDPDRTYAMVGIAGLAPYWIETELQAFVSHKGDVHLRGQAAYDERITQRLILEPEIEFDIAMQDVPELGIGSGFESVELSTRLRYAIEPNLAPYVGISWERKLSGTADYARLAGEKVKSFRWVAGLRFWF